MALEFRGAEELPAQFRPHSQATANFDCGLSETTATSYGDTTKSPSVRQDPTHVHTTPYRISNTVGRPSTTGTMGDAQVTASNWRLVEVGRVAEFAKGPYTGRLVAIVQIIDHKRVCSPLK